MFLRQTEDSSTWGSLKQVIAKTATKKKLKLIMQVQKMGLLVSHQKDAQDNVTFF